MSVSTYEYKTVALPQTVLAKRKRGMNEADLVAETLGELIHIEAVDGWEYMRSDVLAAGSRGGMFSKEAKITHYTVLIFRRMQEGAWPTEMALPRTPAEVRPEPTVAPKPAPAPAPSRPVMPLVNDPTSPLAQGDVLTTGGQFRANQTIGSSGLAPRPPLGSAQD